MSTASELQLVINNGSLVGYTGTPIDVVLPEGITKITYRAFCNARSLKSISIPDGVTVIENSAFDGCCNLVSVKLPDSLTRIGACAFQCCSSLESVSLPNGLTQIGESAFQQCASLQEISLPDTLEKMGKKAFFYCTGLKSVRISGRLTYIERSSFNGCSGIISINLPDTIEEIGPLAFRACLSLASVSLPASLKQVDFFAFADCPMLDPSSMIASSNASIDRSAFEGCKNDPFATGDGTTRAFSILDEELNVPFLQVKRFQRCCYTYVDRADWDTVKFCNAGDFKNLPCAESEWPAIVEASNRWILQITHETYMNLNDESLYKKETSKMVDLYPRHCVMKNGRIIGFKYERFELSFDSNSCTVDDSRYSRGPFEPDYIDVYYAKLVLRE